MRYLLAILAFLLFCTSMTTAQTAAILSPSVLCTNRPPFLLVSSWFPRGFLVVPKNHVKHRIYTG